MAGIIKGLASGCVFVALCFIFNPVFGQDMDGVIKKYSNEQAVITNFKEQLVIRDERGTLVARSNISKETLLIGELSPSLYNKDYIYHSYFDQLDDYDAEALAPGKNGYEKLDKPASSTTLSEDNNIFYDDVKQTEISFTGLTPKSIMRTNYTLSYPDLHMLPEYYFQKSLPVAKSTFEVTAPKYVEMAFVIKGSHADWVKKSTQENKNTITYTFETDDIPAFKDYNDVPATSWYTLQIVPYIKGYKLPGEDSTQMLGNPTELYAYLYHFIKNVNVREDPTLGATVATITKGDKTDREKATHIYQWVQHNIHYIAFEDSLEGFIPRQAADICRRKFGDCKDMASILTAMCRIAGIEAHLTWIGTRSKPYTYEETPLPLVANHMICAIKLDGKWIFLDGTHPIIPFGTYPSGIQGKEALIAIDDKRYEIYLIPEVGYRSNVTTDTTFLNIKGSDVFGNSITDLQGYPSWELQTTMLYYKNGARDKTFQSFNSRGSNKYEQERYSYTPSDTGNKNSRVTADFTIGDYVQQVGKEYYVNLNVNRAFEGKNIDTAGRQVPVYVNYQGEEHDVVALNIPDGYHMSYLPPNDSGSLTGIWNYKIHYQLLGRKIILTKDYYMLSMAIPQQSFAGHNKLADQLGKQYKESVVLTADQ